MTIDVPATDPAVYASYEAKWATLPDTSEAWLARAREVAEVLAQDAAQRDQENKSPRAEVALLKHSGLLKLLGPQKYGGGEQPWSVGYQAIREVAKTDGSIGMLLGYHLLWSTTANVVGTPEQIERTHHLIISNNYFVGGAVNPRDSDLKITSDGDHIVFNGAKHFNTGGVVSDLTVLEGVLEGTEGHIFALVETKQPGISFAHNWHNIGLRLTESGGVKIENIRVPWRDALGWDETTKQPREDILLAPFATLLLPTIQLVFSNFYLGIAIGALEFASKYTTNGTRPWPFGGDNKESATDEFYILERYGNFFAHLRATETLADRAGEQLSELYIHYGANRSALTAEERGEVAEWVASVKVVTTDVGLRVTSGVFEVTGARATALKVGLDRFWRDIRTHTLHDPVAYKNRELGSQALPEVGRCYPEGEPPHLMIAIGGGGYVPARILRSFLKGPGDPNIPIQAIGLSLYEDLGRGDAEEVPGTKVTRTQWLDLSSLEMANLIGKNILIVDEVDDTRTTLEYAVRELEKDVQIAQKQLGREGEKTNFSIFVLHNKNKEKKGTLPADMMESRYHASVTTDDVWICYPWEARDIDEHDALAKENPII
ncbi:hypothetical protein N7451_001442 [Penicillium sp. IBT 35674x]|nr:hypothetical protein N7451_001442 [Penicillium sp. IBT 35674x]